MVHESRVVRALVKHNHTKDESPPWLDYISFYNMQKLFI